MLKAEKDMHRINVDVGTMVLILDGSLDHGAHT